MSVQRTDSQPHHPVITTTTNTTTSTTTTTTVSANAESAPPSLAPRPIGWHAKASGFDWNKRSDQHRYRLSIGLPEVHAAVVNQDWETAAEMLCADDIGLLWLPPVSQHNSAHDGKDTEHGAWAVALPSKDQSIRLEAIRQMAIDLGSKTLVEGAGCLYGANLLTLCLQTSAPPEFMQKLIAMLQKHSPQYLNLPDASGRTPLYIAVDQGDDAQVRMLLEAGANPDAPCRFAAKGLSLKMLGARPRSANNHSSSYDHLFKPADNAVPNINAYDYALASGNLKIFSLMVDHLLRSSNWRQDYPINEDPLKLEEWASLHTEDELRALASQFNNLKSFLFNQKDKSGSSIVERTLSNKEPMDKGVIPLFRKDPKLGAIYAAAVVGDVRAFAQSLSTYIEQQTRVDHRVKANTDDLIKIFLINCDPSDIPQLLAQCTQLEPFLKNLKRNPQQLLDLPFKNFSALLSAIWLTINQADRELIAYMSGGADSRYTQAIIELPGFVMPRNTYAANTMILLAAQSGNTMAFEFAAAHLDDFDKLISGISSATDFDKVSKSSSLLRLTLGAGSLLWFEKFMNAGLNLQAFIDSDGETILPLMADLSPERLGSWLKGININVTAQMIDKASTSEGRNALQKLIKQEKADTKKADTEKVDS